MTDRKSVLIRAEPALWTQVESYASKEGITRNEAVIRLLGAGLGQPKSEIRPRPQEVVVNSPGSERKPKPRKAAEVVVKPVPDPGGHAETFRKVREQTNRRIAEGFSPAPKRPTLDLPVGPVSRAPGSMLKGNGR